MSFTHGQTAKLKTINKAHFTGLAPARQVSAITNWIAANNKVGGLTVFPITKDNDLGTYVEAIANHLGIYAANPTFQLEVKKLKGGGDLYKEVIGSKGRVPSDVVYQVCERFKIQRALIVEACGKALTGHGGNGVKSLNNHKTYKAELKLMAMGGERIYATAQQSGVWVFDKVAKHT